MRTAGGGTPVAGIEVFVGRNINDAAQLSYDVKTKDKVVTVEFDVWQNQRSVKVPFNVKASLALDRAPGTETAAPSMAGGSSGSRRSKRRAVTREPTSAPPSEKRVRSALFPDGRGGAVARVHTRVVAKAEKHLRDRSQERVVIAARQIGAAD